MGLGSIGDIGELKSDVSGHRDVTFKPAREGLKEGKDRQTDRHIGQPRSRVYDSLLRQADFRVRPSVY